MNNLQIGIDILKNKILLSLQQPQTAQQEANKAISVAWEQVLDASA